MRALSTECADTRADVQEKTRADTHSFEKQQHLTFYPPPLSRPPTRRALGEHVRIGIFFGDGRDLLFRSVIGETVRAFVWRAAMRVYQR
jgi:hypothetical protein